MVKNDKWKNSSHCEKGDKNDLTLISKTYARPHTMRKKTHAKFQNNWYKTVRGNALIRGTSVYILSVKMTKFTTWKKVTKNDLTIISKLHSHPHTMKKIHAKFLKDRYKTVRGVALTRGTHRLHIEAEKWLSSQPRHVESDEIWSNNYIKTIYTFSNYEENTCKFQNDRYKSVTGVVLTKHPG